jgi:hypothetical protein
LPIKSTYDSEWDGGEREGQWKKKEEEIYFDKRAAIWLFSCISPVACVGEARYIGNVP